MSLRTYSVIRDAHLYAGLFLSPFIVLFALSVIFLVHSWFPGAGAKPEVAPVQQLRLPANFAQMKGREQVEAAHIALDQIGLKGEIGFVRQFPKESRVVMPVSVPGRETIVDVDLESGAATLSTRDTGLWDAMVYLHKMPGPHNVAIRGNAAFIGVWSYFADITVYLLMFLTASGVYLWAVLRNERGIGMTLLVAGALSFGGLIYAVV
jgi:hypothetical protein